LEQISRLKVFRLHSSRWIYHLLQGGVAVFQLSYFVEMESVPRGVPSVTYVRIIGSDSGTGDIITDGHNEISVLETGQVQHVFFDLINYLTP
jgi:hypothetical protein